MSAKTGPRPVAGAAPRLLPGRQKPAHQTAGLPARQAPRARLRTARLPAGALAALLVVGACAGPGPQTSTEYARAIGSEPLPLGRTWLYACGDLDVAARLEGEAMRLFLPEGAVLLPPTPTASGARFGDGAVTFWSKGDEALLQTPTLDLTECRGEPVEDPWRAAKLRGVEFRAIGQEPGWVLEIERGVRLDLLADYGTRRIVVPAPAPELDAAAGSTVYGTRTEAHDLDVEILDRPCQDIMSGEAFPASVTLRLDDRELSGCGRPAALMPADDGACPHDPTTPSFSAARW